MRTAAEEKTWLAEVVGDRFVVGDERSELKAPVPDWVPLFCCMYIPMDNVVVKRGRAVEKCGRRLGSRRTPRVEGQIDVTFSREKAHRLLRKGS